MEVPPSSTPSHSANRDGKMSHEDAPAADPSNEHEGKRGGGSERPLRIAYVSEYDAHDRTAWSGLVYRIREALAAQDGVEIIPLMGLRKPALPWSLGVAKKIFYRFASRKEYRRDRAPVLLKSYASQLEQRLAEIEADVVFSPGTPPVAYLATDLPLVIFTDASFGGLLGYYPEYGDLCRESQAAAFDQENRVLGRCLLAAYASEWAARGAIRHHGLSRDRAAVVPFGANQAADYSTAELESRIDEKLASNSCRILFNGVDWERKGGPLAVDTVAELRMRGIDAELDIVGCHPPGSLPDWATAHGFISRQTTTGREKIDSLFARSHFLLLPSRAECFGIVFAEASSHGLPSIATETGGIPGAVKEGLNGHLLPLSAGPAAYADLIERYHRNPADYRALSESSTSCYRTSLNWNAVGKSLVEEIAARL